MNYKDALKDTIKEIKEMGGDVSDKIDGTELLDLDLHMASHNKMVQGPWQRLGIAIDKMLETPIKSRAFHGEDQEKDYTTEMTVDEAIETAKSLCAGFFDTFEKELDEMQYLYLFENKKRLREKKKSKKDKD